MPPSVAQTLLKGLIELVVVGRGLAAAAGPAGRLSAGPLAQMTGRIASVVARQRAELIEHQPTLPFAGLRVALGHLLVIAHLSAIDRATVAALLAARMPRSKVGSVGVPS